MMTPMSVARAFRCLYHMSCVFLLLKKRGLFFFVSPSLFCFTHLTAPRPWLLHRAARGLPAGRTVEMASTSAPALATKVRARANPGARRVTRAL
jgi:hypothetical protein